MSTENKNIISMSDNFVLIIFFILILLFWNFGDNKYDLYDFIYIWCEKALNIPIEIK